MSLKEPVNLIMRAVQIDAHARALARPSHDIAADAALPDRQSLHAGTCPLALQKVEQEAREQALEQAFGQARREAHAQGHAEGCEAGFSSGRDAGYLAGLDAGMAQASKANQDQLALLANLVQSVSAQVGQGIAQAEQDMLALVFDIVCRIIGEHALTRAGVQHLLTQARSALAASPLFTVRLHAQDLATLQGNPDFIARFDGDGQAAGKVHWLADARMQLGGCMLDSANGSLDARLETQMQKLKQTLLETRQMRSQAEWPC